MPVPTNSLDLWAKKFLGDRFDLECVGQAIDGWRSSYTDAWIKAAIQIAVVAGVKAGGLGSYVTKILIRWESKGEPDHEEMNRARAKLNGKAEAIDVYDSPDFNWVGPPMPIQPPEVVRATRDLFRKGVGR